MDTSSTAQPRKEAETTESTNVVDLGDAKSLTKGWQSLEAYEPNPIRPTKPAM